MSIKVIRFRYLQTYLDTGTNSDRIVGIWLVPSDAMKSKRGPYPGQFERTPDPFIVAIPRKEIVREMARRGDEPTLNDVCLAVAVVAEAMATILTTI